MSDPPTVERMTALRAMTVRGGAAATAMGIVAAAASTTFIAVVLGRRAPGWPFWTYVGVIMSVVVAATTLLMAQRWFRPTDHDLIARWLPMARLIGLTFMISVAISPWILLPLATAAIADVIYLNYAWFLVVLTVFSADDDGHNWVGLLGLPASLSIYALTHDADFAWPLAAVFMVMGLTLVFYNARRQSERLKQYRALIARERREAWLHQELDSVREIAAAAPPAVGPLGNSEALTPRQREVLGSLVKGRTNKEIARELGISPATVKIHVSQIMATMGAVNRTHLTSSVLREGHGAGAADG